MLHWIFTSSLSRSVMSDSLQPHGLNSPWNCPGRNTGVGSLFPSPGDLPQPRDQTQVSCIAGRFFTSWAIKGSPRILEWVAYPFSSGSSWPRNQTRSPALQVDSLPTELSGKSTSHGHGQNIKINKITTRRTNNNVFQKKNTNLWEQRSCLPWSQETNSEEIGWNLCSFFLYYI